MDQIGQTDEINVNLPVPKFICLGQGLTRNSMFDAAMIKLWRECSQTILNIPKAFPKSQLSKTHNIERIPAGEVPDAVIAFVTSNTFVKFVFWKHGH